MQNQNSSKPSAGGNATKKKGRNKPEELLVITKAKDLVKHSFILTSNTKRYPKKYRFTLVNRIQDKAMLVYECLVEANELNLSIPEEREKRLGFQAKALTYCKELLFLIELSLELQLLSVNSCEYWTKMVLDVRHMTAAWYKKDRERV